MTEPYNWENRITDKITVYGSANELIYGRPDPSASQVEMADANNDRPEMGTARASVGRQVPNRTDAVLYSGGQLLSGGDFETEWLHGWTVSGTATSVRGESPQGARYLELSEGTTLTQRLPLRTNRLLADSGAVLLVWHKGEVSVSLVKNRTPVQMDTLSGSDSWKLGMVPYAHTLFDDKAFFSLTVSAGEAASIDDMVLIPGSAAKPSNYATRFTNTAGDEMETRRYDGEREQLVTTSLRDSMGRAWKKYLPFALPCNSVTDCNSNLKTLYNPGMAVNYYTAANPDYPDADGVPYFETKWKPDPMATKDVEGAPGRAFGVDSTHLVWTYSSGVNLSGINLLDFTSLNSVVVSVPHGRVYDGGLNYHALMDMWPTHLWELSVDQDGRRAFTVKDGEGRIIVSGALDSNGSILTRSVNELDARGNVIKSHPPMSCEYTDATAECVSPSTYEYDAESRVIRSREPDAGETRTYYDIAGRIRATQTQRQIESGCYSVVGYDDFDRVIYAGEWKTALDSGAARAYFNDVQNRFNPTVDELTPGTVTRTFYDRMPARDTLGVELYPAGTAVTHTRGRVAAVVSDVVLVNGSGNADSVVRVSSANSYDKYGRVLATYTYDPTMPADSLKLFAVENEYDVGGKLTRTTRYPYGYGTWGHARAITERYTYDRLGRVDSVLSRNGDGNETVLARYEYYPDGKVKTVNMGHVLKLTYTYHISGALRTAKVTTANGAEWYSETLHYEDCGDDECTPQYNGNISYMAQRIAHSNRDFVQNREVAYYYDQLNRLTRADDLSQDYFDDIFEYDAQGRITAQRRAERVDSTHGGEYAYKSGTNQLVSVADGIGGTADGRNMGESDNFVYDSEGNLIEDKSKSLKISYDWRGMPVEFIRETCTDYNGYVVCDSTKLIVAYDGSGRRISKTRLKKTAFDGPWYAEHVTHYTGIGTEVRENLVASEPVTQVVVNMPQGLGRYGIESAGNPGMGAKSFEWYLKNHLGSTMLVYGSGGGTSGGLQAAYDYRSFGEQIELTPPSTGKVTENFTGKEKDDETQLDYFGARYLDPMLGMWISVDPKRQFASPYLYAGNGYNPVNIVDPDGNAPLYLAVYFNKKNSGGRNADYDAQKSVRRLKRNISNRVDTELNQVEVRAFAEGEAMEMMEWLNESGSEGFRAIMTHGGKGRMYITDIPFTDDDNPGKHRISYDELELHLRPTFIGQCYGKENIDTKKYPSLIPPSEDGIVSVEKAAAEYLINNATKKTEENE